MLAVKADNPTIGCSAIKNETFRTLMQEWLMTFKRPSVSPRTFERCLSNARNTLYPVFGDMKIDEITAPMLQRLFNKMISDGYALATVKKSKFLLGQFFEYCVDNDFLKTNPVAKTRLASRERKVQTTEEYKALTTAWTEVISNRRQRKSTLCSAAVWRCNKAKKIYLKL